MFPVVSQSLLVFFFSFLFVFMDFIILWLFLFLMAFWSPLIRYDYFEMYKYIKWIKTKSSLVSCLKKCPISVLHSAAPQENGSKHFSDTSHVHNTLALQQTGMPLKKLFFFCSFEHLFSYFASDFQRRLA